MPVLVLIVVGAIVVYIISIYTPWSYPDKLALFQSTANGIMSSLVIK